LSGSLKAVSAILAPLKPGAVSPVSRLGRALANESGPRGKQISFPRSVWLLSLAEAEAGAPARIAAAAAVISECCAYLINPAECMNMLLRMTGLIISLVPLKFGRRSVYDDGINLYSIGLVQISQRSGDSMRNYIFLEVDFLNVKIWKSAHLSWITLGNLHILT
jgi:hypothetical protein